MRICVLLPVSLFLFLGSLKAQTTLIDPAGAGGFALGNTFQSNGWTVSNFENVNGWAIGNSFDANKSAFASPNWEDASPLPGIDVSDLGKSFHFYRDITLPANETVVELSFRFRMDRGYFTVGVATTDYVPGITNLQVPTSMGNTLYQANFFSTSQTPNWFPVSRYVPASFAGTTIRLVFTGYYAPTLSPPAQAQGPAVIDISLTSRAAMAFESVPGTFAWTNPDAWLPKGIPVAGDDATITAGSTITGGPGSSVNNLTVAGSLTSNIGVVTGDLVVTNTGRYVPQITNLSINGHFTVQQGGFVDARLPSIIFSRSLEVPALQQVFSFHSPQQFEGATIRALVISNAEGMRVQAAGGRLAVCSLVNIATGTLVTNDALELNHQTIANIPYTAISFNGSSTWSAPIPRAADARVGLLYNGSQGTPENPYILGTRGEWAANDTLYEFTLGNISSHIKSPDDLKVAATIGSRFRLFGVLQMEVGKSVIITESAFPGTTPQGFPGPATTNIFNNAHVAGGGVVFRLNGTNLNRVWPVGVDGQQFVLGMYGINATNALVRVEALKSEEGTAGAALNTINPLYRYKVEVLEGTIEKVDSVNLGFNVPISGFVAGDQANRRVAISTSLNGTYEAAGGPTGGELVINSFRPEWNIGWVRSDAGNYNTAAYYALALSTGNFAIMWRNNTGGELSWDDPANWTGNNVPTASDPVILNAPGTTITVSESSTCSQLTVTNGTNVVVPPGVSFEVGGN